jgi:cytochrome c oxidase subunit II
VNIPSQILTLLAGILLTLVSLWYGQNHNLLPAAAAQVAPAIDNLFGAMLTIGTGIFLLVNGVLIYSAIRYRRQPGDDTDGPNVHGNIPLEILWTAIPAIIVLAISVYSFDIYSNETGMSSMDHAMGHSKHQVASRSGTALAGTLVAQADPNQQAVESVMKDEATSAVQEETPARRDSPVLSSPRIGDPSKPAELVVNAAGMQYAWLFTYPDTEVIAGELHLPVGREVLMNISANDVLHAFWVPEFRLKQDAIPGRESQIRFTPTLEGDYPVICAELCGAYHGAMKTHVVVESEAAFQDWLNSQIALAKSETRVAINPAEMTDEQYLAPYAKELGVTAETLSSLHSHS